MQLSELLVEGVFPITPSMRLYAKEAATIIQGMYLQPTERKIRYANVDKDWETGDIIKVGIVDGGKYGSKNVTTKIDHNIRSSGVAVIDKNTILVKPRDFLPIDSYREIIEHELVHLFDPKLSSKFDSKPWGYNQRQNTQFKSDEYYNLPWEIDAYIASQARSMVNWYLPRQLTKEQIKERIQAPIANSEFEKAIVNNKKIWRKYKRALAQAYYERYQEYL